MELSDRIDAFAPEHDKRDEVLVQLFTLRRYAADARTLEEDVASLTKAHIGLEELNSKLATKAWERREAVKEIVREIVWILFFWGMGYWAGGW